MPPAEASFGNSTSKVCAEAFADVQRVSLDPSVAFPSVVSPEETRMVHP
jgi:hypothetical protein